MNRLSLISITILILIISLAQTSNAAWPLYTKPEFRGRMIDAETKQPLEGAVAVVLYLKRPLIGGPGGPNSYVFHAKETLTDSKGEFYFPSYSSLILFTEDVGAEFIFYKRGYMASYGPTHINATLVEKYFSADVIGKIAEIEEGRFEDSSYVKWSGPLGIIELKSAKTREDKLRAIPSPPFEYTSKELPIFIRIINEEGKNLGLKGAYK